MIYFVQAGVRGPVKIGKADDVAARVAGLATAHYEALAVLATLDVPNMCEGKLHRLLQAHRIRGEWFRWCPEVEAVVDLARAGRLPEFPSDEPPPTNDPAALFDDPADSLRRIRQYLAANGYVSVATKAGLAKATLLRFREPEWNPQHATLNAVASVMGESLHYDIPALRDFIVDLGPVRAARLAGLAKAALLPAARPEWNPRHSTIEAVVALMVASDEAA